MAEAVSAANADVSEAGAGVGARRTVENMDRSTAVTTVDIGEAEAQKRAVVNDGNYSGEFHRQLQQQTLRQMDDLHSVRLQVLTNMADVAQKNSLRAVKMVTDVADSAIAAEIADNTGDA